MTQPPPGSRSPAEPDSAGGIGQQLGQGLGDQCTVGYCTNVHAGTDLASIRKNLSTYAVAAREYVDPDAALGVGLWLPAEAAGDLVRGGTAEFKTFLADRKLFAYTINGFPYDNFHQKVVKQSVYLPAWWDDDRREYTKRLAAVLADLLPESQTSGSISTLPIGWPNNPLAARGTDGQRQADTPEMMRRAGENFRDLADSLQRLEQTTGRRIVVAIEPEPGCLIDTTDDCIEWFEKQLPEEKHRRYITVCHDVCHAAVMMEDQRDLLGRLAAAGIGIGKVQVSSAVVAEWVEMSDARQREAIEQLREFAEDRYLHQTGRLTGDGEFVLAEDLPELIRRARTAERAAIEGRPSGGDGIVGGDQRWVVHFHVPVFLERFGHLGTTGKQIGFALQALGDASLGIDFTGHLEIETYAWTVLPQEMRKRGLAEDIASEIRWLKRTIRDVAVGRPGHR